MIQVTSLRKTYGTTVALDDVSLAVEEGEVFGVDPWIEHERGILG